MASMHAASSSTSPMCANEDGSGHDASSEDVHSMLALTKGVPSSRWRTIRAPGLSSNSTVVVSVVAVSSQAESDAGVAIVNELVLVAEQPLRRCRPGPWLIASCRGLSTSVLAVIGVVVRPRVYERSWLLTCAQQIERSMASIVVNFVILNVQTKKNGSVR